MKFFDQYLNPAPAPELDPDIFIPLEGFTGEHVEQLSTLVRRLESGQFVNTLEDGVYVDEQVLDSEYLDRFDVLDRSEQMTESLKSTQSERPQRKEPSQKVETGAVPDSEIAAPGEP